VTREKRQHWQHRPAAAQFLRCKVVMLVALSSPAAAQGIRGLEVCTAEKQSCARNNLPADSTSQRIEI
jgi:hypothetical protein